MMAQLLFFMLTLDGDAYYTRKSNYGLNLQVSLLHCDL
jgi:hypothetical protein